MRRLYPFLRWLWASIFAVVVGGPLSIYIHDWLEGYPPLHSFQRLEAFLLAYGGWLAAGLLTFGGLTLWSYLDRKRHEENKKPKAQGDNVIAGTASNSQVVQASQAGRDIVNVGRDYYAAAPAMAATPAVVVPRQLPPPPADFVGREAELDEIVAAVRKGGAAISGLRGMGGIGKTALALRIGETLATNFPDGQLYLDLKGAPHVTDPPWVKPLTVAEAMAYVIRSYDRTGQLPESEAALEALYRTVLAGKRALILMDNALDGAQVEPLIPPAGCALLVTSRQNFTLPGLFAKNLDTLPPPRARELLLKIAPRIGEHADALASLCGYLPQALRNAAGAFSERPNLSPEDLVRRMRDAQERLKLTGVDLSLTVSAGLLSADLKGRWLQLAVFPDSFDRPGAAAVWGLPPDAAQDTLGELLRYSLLEWNSASLRYRMHDLVRDFAGAQLGEAGRAEAQSRHAAHYKNVLAAADQLYQRGADAVTQGLALFDLERGNVRAGQAWSAAHAGGDDVGARLCVDYPDAGAYVLFLRLHPRELIDWFEAALGAARRLGDRGAEGRALGNLGNAYFLLGNHRRAIEFHEQVRAIFREIGDRRGEGNALGSLGNAYHARGEYRRAIQFYEQARAISREIGDREGEGAALGNLGLAYRSLGDCRRAIEFHEQACAIAREIGDRRGEGNALGGLGVAYDSLGDYRRAIEFHEQHLAIAREIGDRHGEGNALNNLGLAYDSLGDHRPAIEFCEQALAIAREIGDRRGEGNALGNLGNAYHARGEYRRAIEFHEQRLAIAREIGERRGEGTAFGNLGSAYGALGEYRRALESHEQHLAIAREIGDRRGEANALFNSALALAALSDHAEAIARAEAALKIYEQIESPDAARARKALAEWRGPK
ncbi:MAG: tetratricopeptide repeat protein [Candidatus Binataceae bacterium]